MTRLFVLAAAAIAVALGACGGDDGADTADESTTTTAPVADEPAVPGLDIIDADLVDADEQRPLLSWSAVDGAARYSLLVLGDDGAAYWAWEGAETQVHLGGGTDEPLPDDAEGPSAEHASSWFVVAHDGEGAPIASSAELPFGD